MDNGAQKLVSVSGGKDSTALYLLALERLGHDGYRAVFADTGHEHPLTLDCVETLAERTGGPPVEIVRADFTTKFAERRRNIAEKWPAEGVADNVVERALTNLTPTGVPFLDMCMLQAGFPSAFARYCTEKLKVKPIQQQIYIPLLTNGIHIESWQGVRREESLARRDLSERQRMQSPPNTPKSATGTLTVYRPLLDWTLSDVWSMHRKHSVDRNPLYDMGSSRVGCMPCVMANKLDLRVFAERYPDQLERVAEWERIVGQVAKNSEGRATFFPPKKSANESSHDIRAVGKWASTSLGGKSIDLIPLADSLSVDFGTSCGEWNACE